MSVPTPSTDGAPDPEEVVVDLMQALQDSITAARPEPDLVGRIDKILASGLVLQEGPRGLLFAARDELAESRTRIAALEAVRSKVIEDLNDARIADPDARQYALEDLMTLTKEDPHD